ncbi:MAG: FKBP-type peptidyl-prolyl cis-trans isomerase [Solobacterium sp.]|nr:FKBP-type peptidyl-prolyl cis-trans isomerase [Solobacterium sp.]
MKIAVTYENEEVFQHFGKTEQFKVYTVEDNRVVSTIVLSSNGQGHGALAGLLGEQNIDVLICGGIGEHAREALATAGIKVVAGAQGKADAAVGDYLDGKLTGSDASCDHHHEDGEGCGHHEEGCEENCDPQSCGGCGGGCGGMQLVLDGKNAGKKCTVHYKGTFNDGTQFDSSYDRGQPLEFICGAGMMIRGFDQAVADMEVGEKVNVHLMPEEAYGMPNPAAIMKIPFTDLPGAEQLEIGERVILADEYGRQFPVRAVEKDETTITLDANHEMAGKELNFLIELVSVEG